MDVNKTVDGGNETREVAQLARTAVGVQRVVRGTEGTGVPVMLVPDGFRLEAMDEFQMDRPDRVRATVGMVDLESFVSYVNEHKGPNSRVFASVLAEPFGLTCAIDWHGDNTSTAKNRPEFVTHVCKLTFTATDAWREWKGRNGQRMAQDAFALFVEERQPDIVDPNGADMLELARSIEATRDVSFKRRIRLENGDTSFAFDDKTEATAGMNGQLRIPEKMLLKFALFLGMPEQVIECRFRYQLDGGRMTLAYEIVRPQALLLNAVRDALKMVTEVTGVPSFLGSYETKA
jgi:uncharacterized protein YfdQ (DUF2303 family)